MGFYAENVVAQARSWLGLKEANGSYQVILDTYNSQKTLPRNHKMTTSDPWCAAFVTAVAVKLGYTDVIPPECSCNRMIHLLKAQNAWQEQDHLVPKPGWLLFFNWEASEGEDTGEADHVGIVESVQNGKITVIEGNYQKAVKRRTIGVNYPYIRGFGVPKYDTAPKKREEYELKIKLLKPGCKGEDVRALQILLMGRGYSCGNCGADGVFGNDTHRALCAYQRAKGLEVDGIAGQESMGSLLGAA